MSLLYIIMLTWGLQESEPVIGTSRSGNPLHDQHPESIPTTEKIASKQQKPVELCFGMVGLLFHNSFPFRNLEFAPM